MKCSICGNNYEGNFCTECGSKSSPPNTQPHYNPQQAQTVQTSARPVLVPDQKFCKFCGSIISLDAVVCVACGRQVEQLAQQPQYQPPPIFINNSPQMGYGRPPCIKDKWIAFVLCLFLGWLGVHKFYEGKILLGMVYLFTFGLFRVGAFVDCIILLFKPNPYSV